MKIIQELARERWALGFIHGGMDAVMRGISQEKRLEVDWVKMPKDRWYADPFLLDVTETEILLLVEDYAYDAGKGVISLLHIDRESMEITSRKVLLEKNTHLSFPAILRRNGHMYVYPESAQSGKLDMYEYHQNVESLTFYKTICDDIVWDSWITEFFGKPLLFTTAKNNYQLDIYCWDTKIKRYVPCMQIPSEKPNSRLGGAIFEYEQEYYYPAQDCSRNYGSAIDIKRINYSEGKFELSVIKHLTLSHPNYQLGMHTLNEYKGVVVIDVHGFRYGWFGAIIAKIAKCKKKFLRRIV